MNQCRLCLSDHDVVNVFNSQLEYGERLRDYILLATGINMKREDLVSTTVCHKCCDMTIKLYKFRLDAIWNDLLLKQKCGQKYALEFDELKKVTLKIYSNVNSALKTNVPITKTHPTIQKLYTCDNTLPAEASEDNTSPVKSPHKNAYSSTKYRNTSGSDTPDKCSSPGTPDSPYVVVRKSTDTDSNLKLTIRRKRTHHRPSFVEPDSEEPARVILRTENSSTSSPVNNRSETVDSPASIANTNQENLKKNSGNSENVNLVTEFKDYGIHFENGEPVIEICDDDGSIDGNDVICLSDELAESNNNEHSEIQLLFDNHYHFMYKLGTPAVDGQEKDLFILRNIKSEVDKYYIPVEIQCSQGVEIKIAKKQHIFESGISSSDLWYYMECIDVEKPGNQHKPHCGTSGKTDVVATHASPNLENHLNVTVTAQQAHCNEVPATAAVITIESDNEDDLNVKTKCEEMVAEDEEMPPLIPIASLISNPTFISNNACVSQFSVKSQLYFKNTTTPTRNEVQQQTYVEIPVPLEYHQVMQSKHLN